MSWLGQGFSRESMQSMADAFVEVTEGTKTEVPGAKIGGICLYQETQWQNH